MALSAGDRLGAYQIVGLLGAGGMGEVYRAHDTSLGRDVAIKILPDTFAHDPERLARFEREAKTLAGLNHPHIAHLYGFERSADAHALVMELVEGSTLADRIALGPVPLDEALQIARQVAEALEAAHDSGIIHRDLKPRPATFSLGPRAELAIPSSSSHPPMRSTRMIGRPTAVSSSMTNTIRRGVRICGCSRWLATASRFPSRRRRQMSS